MARKDPFHVVRIHLWVYKLLEEKRKAEGKMLGSMTLYIENILLAHAQSKAQQSPAGGSPPAFGASPVEGELRPQGIEVVEPKKSRHGGKGKQKKAQRHATGGA